jgi:hypothetical protein
LGVEAQFLVHRCWKAAALAQRWPRVTSQ